MTECQTLSQMESGGLWRQVVRQQQTREDTDRITLSWNNITVSTKSSHQRTRFALKMPFTKTCNSSNPSSRPRSNVTHILKGVSGVCRPGEVLAVLGSSGAGKTTLLDVLTQRTNADLQVSGEIFANGTRIQPNFLTSNSAYVQQDDLFAESLTVREQLVFHAMLRMAPYFTNEERLQRVTEVINELGLVKCQHSLIGGRGETPGKSISGGERKRLSFACEMLTNPQLLFCDEPTSGLDSFMAGTVVAVMKNMTKGGKTIISTMHQPSSDVYAMFDRIMLMAEGSVAFLGTTDEALQFFTHAGLPCPPKYNPAEFFLDKLSLDPSRADESRRQVDKICTTFAASKWNRMLDSEMKSKENDSTNPVVLRRQSEGEYGRYRCGWLRQLRWVIWRVWLQTKKEPRLINLRAVQVVTVITLFVLLYGGQEMNEQGVFNLTGLSYLIIGNTSTRNILAVIHVFCSDRQIFLREHQNGMYRPSAYFLGHSLVQAPIYTTYAAVIAVVTYYAVGYDRVPTKVAVFVLVAVLTSWNGVSFGYFLSCASPTLSVALFSVEATLIVLRIVCGIFINIKSIPKAVDWLRYFSWLRFGFEALQVNQWSDIAHINCTHTTRCYPNGQAVLQYYGFSDSNIAYNVSCLLGLAIFYRCVAFWIFLLKTRRNKIGSSFT